MPDERLTLESASAQSGLPAETLHGLIVRGQLKAERDPRSGGWVIAPDELRRYLHDHPPP